MSNPFGGRPFPRSILFAAGAMLCFVMAAVGVVRFGGDEPGPRFESAIMESRSLQFVDRADGSVAVYDPASEQLVKVLEPGTNGFIRGVLRGMARERRAYQVGAQPPFELRRWADGRLSLLDPSTGRQIDLNAFGATNLAAFAQLLEANEAKTNERSAAGSTSAYHAVSGQDRRPQQGANEHDG